MPTIAERLGTAVQFHQAGRLPEAERLYRDILQEMPSHVRALYLLGVLTLQTGRFSEAITFLRQALAVHGPDPTFHSSLAAGYIGVGQFVDAEIHARAALRLRPDFADAHNNLGIALRSRLRLDEAEIAFRAALVVNPRHADALCNLGDVLSRLGKQSEALPFLQESVRLAPEHAQAQTNLGGVLIALGHYDAAGRHLREAIRLRPEFPRAHNNLGVALDRLDRPDEAIRSFHEALRLAPDYATAHNNLASALRDQGKLDEALAEFLEVRRLEPKNTQAMLSLSRFVAVGQYHPSDEEVRDMEELTARPDLSVASRCQLHFALARVLDKKGAYADAFAHCRRANQLGRELQGDSASAFDLAEQRRRIDRLIAAFTPAYFERVRSFGFDSELPVSIVGMPRSGTSLAEQILASHPQVHGAGELAEIDALIASLPGRLAPAAVYPESVDLLEPAMVRALAEGHLQRLRQLGGAALRVVDKAPLNFLHLGIIATLFPRARIVHTVRDPFDTCLSCYFENFAEPFPFSRDLQHLGQFYREYKRLMDHWKNVLPLPVFELRYEELTTEQEMTTRKLVAFCGLPWDERCMRFHEAARVVRTISAVQVRQPMYRSSVGRSKHYAAYLQPLIEALGKTCPGSEVSRHGNQ